MRIGTDDHTRVSGSPRLGATGNSRQGRGQARSVYTVVRIATGGVSIDLVSAATRAVSRTCCSESGTFRGDDAGDCHEDAPILLLAALGLIPGAGTADVLTPVTDGDVRDGIGAPKDGIPDFVLENAAVQALDVPSMEERGIMEFSLQGLSLPIERAKLRLPVFSSMGQSLPAYQEDDGSVAWQCFGGTLEPKYRPRECRAAQ
jgi:hypothetical protein